MVSEFWDGRDNRTWVILEINKLLIITIFPNGVRNLPFQVCIGFCISFTFNSIFVSVIFSKSFMLYVIPRDTNSCDQSNFRSSQRIAPLSLHPPILITFVFSLFTLSPLTFSNSPKVNMQFLIVFSFALINNVVSSANWDIFCSL